MYLSIKGGIDQGRNQLELKSWLLRPIIDSWAPFILPFSHVLSKSSQHVYSRYQHPQRT